METGNQCIKFIDLMVEHGYLKLLWFQNVLYAITTQDKNQ